MRRKITTVTIKPDLLKTLKSYSKEKHIDSISRVLEMLILDPGTYQDIRKRIEVTA